MPVNQYTLSGKPVVVVDAVGGNYRITTHGPNELIVDTRRTHNQAILPKVEVSDDRVQIGRQPLLRWLATKLGVDAKIIVPEDSVLIVIMFSGELSVAGRYRSVDLRLHSGVITLDGPYFAYRESGSVKLMSGALRCSRLSEAGFALPWSADKVTHLENLDGTPLRLRLHLVELDFS